MFFYVTWVCPALDISNLVEHTNAESTYADSQAASTSGYGALRLLTYMPQPDHCFSESKVQRAGYAFQ